MIDGANSKYGLPDGLLSAIASAESGYNPNAKNSGSGASGMFQFMPATAKGYGIDPFNPTQAADAAGTMMRYLKPLQATIGAAVTSIRPLSSMAAIGLHMRRQKHKSTLKRLWGDKLG